MKEATVDSYLRIAEEVLEKARRPLTPQQILKRAYLENIVPAELFGTTQHKTLGARLSVDIVKKRENSAFFRTKPGHFFLRRFITDSTIPIQFREPMIARRRVRDIYRGRLLALKIPNRENPHQEEISKSQVTSAIRAGKFRYIDRYSSVSPLEAIVWSFVIVTRGRKALTYRLGKYREDRDTFSLKRSIGFYSTVSEPNLNLFNMDNLGIVETGIEAVHLDLDMPQMTDVDDIEKRSHIETFFIDNSDTANRNLISIIRFECPTWFEPVGRRLAINDLEWLDLDMRVNHVDDFDPWSQRILQRLQQ